MKFGVGFFTGQRPPWDNRSHADFYDDLICWAQLADRAGLDSLWVTEHHFFDDGHLNGLLPLSASLLTATEKINVAAEVLASTHHPIRLAEDAIMCDLISKGRFILALAATYLEFELLPFAKQLKGEPQRIAEALEILRLAFSGKAFSFEGEHFHIPSLTVRPEPYTSNGPRIILGAHGNPQLELQRAVDFGDGYRINPTWPIEDVKKFAQGFLSAKNDDQAEVFVTCYGFVSDLTDPWEVMEPGFRHIRQTYDRMAGGLVPEHIRAATASVIASRADKLNQADYRLVIGNRRKFKETLESYRDSIGDRLHVLMRLSYPGLPAEIVSDAVATYADVAGDIRAGR